MDRGELLHALRRLAVETGSLACLGCGYEHRCTSHGCAILRAAEEALRLGDDDRPVDPESIRFAQDDMRTVTVIRGERAATYYGRYPFGDLQSLRDYLDAEWGETGLITVLAASPFGGAAYQWGNYGEHWVRYGDLYGYA